MPSNSFGDIFTITTWGESHGDAIGVVIDGCPPNIIILEDEINIELQKRRPGKSSFTSPRNEPDKVKILSGIFNNSSTGAPISLLIENKDKDSTSYDKIKDLYRPSHSNFTYKEKYGHFDYRGAGRASARETAARVAAGYIAKKILKSQDIDILAFVNSIGNIDINLDTDLDTDLYLDKNKHFEKLKTQKYKSSIFCPDAASEKQMLTLLQKVKNEKDSIGGTVKLITTYLPTGLGDPIYEKLSANLAKAFLSIPGCVGIEIGNGFNSCKLKGSKNNDLFELTCDKIRTKTNNSGGIQAGITNGMPLNITLAFKPTPTIEKEQKTINIQKKEKTLKISNFRHDICIAIRACSVVEAMASIVLLNALLKNRQLTK